MYIKIGNLEETILSMSNDINFENTSGESNEIKETLSFRLDKESYTVSSLYQIFKDNYNGTIVIVNDNNKEDVYEGFKLSYIRKYVDNLNSDKELQVGLERSISNS